ncbi:2'-5' RNA ligase family protein [Vallitalea pronyensis]|uniref:2'-5' RNA ligase family protein n=1 Tax=Vallitalea pronyensis TaxID=1348613 RepID=A0A8J8MJV2_9FIRM|nr:2'-5' RNA ligase family protein [Vallitalea pronyensis]QUI23004.1 2'-5' RNA ligase family protein [Vallitalea pronyensis]
MEEKFLCVLATFDEQTTRQMKEIEQALNAEGIVGQQTPDLPHHITLGYFDTSREEDIKQLLRDVSKETACFDLAFNHVGLFGLKVLFLAPDVNYALLDLHKKFERESIESEKGWTAHATILIDKPEIIQKALPLVVEKFNMLNARVEKLNLYAFFPTRFIAEYTLQ